MTSLGLLLLRLVTGTIFAIHGYPKLFGGENARVHPQAEQYLGKGFTEAMQHGGVSNLAQMLESMSVPAPKPMATWVALLEFVGGGLLILGWFTRLTSLLLAGDMVVAIQKVHWKNGMVGQGGFEFPTALLGATAALTLTGPGALSIDAARSGAEALLPG